MGKILPGDLEERDDEAGCWELIVLVCCVDVSVLLIVPKTKKPSNESGGPWFVMNKVCDAGESPMEPESKRGSC